MSTNCTIGYINKNGVYENIYCHFDGGLEFTGLTLFKHYKKFEDVKKLIKLGNLNYLAETLEKSKIDNQPFNQINEPNKEWNYLFKKGEWFYRHNNIFNEGKWEGNKGWIKINFNQENSVNNQIKKVQLTKDFDYGI